MVWVPRQALHRLCKMAHSFISVTYHSALTNFNLILITLRRTLKLWNAFKNKQRRKREREAINIEISIAQIVVLSLVTPYTLIGEFRQFGGTFCLHFQGWTALRIISFSTKPVYKKSGHSDPRKVIFERFTTFFYPWRWW